MSYNRDHLHLVFTIDYRVSQERIKALLSQVYHPEQLPAGAKIEISSPILEGKTMKLRLKNSKSAVTCVDPQ